MPDTAPLPGVRRRRPTSSLLLVGLVGLLCFVASYAALRDRDETHDVLYLEETVEAGRVLEADMLAATAVDVDADVLAGLVPRARSGQLVGMVAAHPLREGRLLQSGDLREPAAPASHRAMSVPVSRSHAVAGGLQVADRADVLVATDLAARYVATDLEILATDMGGGGALTAETATVTLAVDAEVARRLADALERGTLHLLRSNGAPQLAAEDLPPSVSGSADVQPGGAAGERGTATGAAAGADAGAAAEEASP